MSKHVWLKKPSQKRANRMMGCIEALLKAGRTIEETMVQTGYREERIIQDSTGYRTLRWITEHDPKTLMNTKNAPLYRYIVSMHTPMMRLLFQRAVESIVGSEPDVPYNVVADACRDWINLHSDRESFQSKLCQMYDIMEQEHRRGELPVPNHKFGLNQEQQEAIRELFAEIKIGHWVPPRYYYGPLRPSHLTTKSKVYRLIPTTEMGIHLRDYGGVMPHKSISPTNIPECLLDYVKERNRLRREEMKMRKLQGVVKNTHPEPEDIE